MPSMASQPPTSPPTAPTRPGIAPSTPSRWLTCSTRSAVSYWPPNFCHLGWSCPPWKNSSTRRQPALPTRHEVRNPSGKRPLHATQGDGSRLTPAGIPGSPETAADAHAEEGAVRQVHVLHFNHQRGVKAAVGDPCLSSCPALRDDAADGGTGEPRLCRGVTSLCHAGASGHQHACHGQTDENPRPRRFHDLTFPSSCLGATPRSAARLIGCPAASIPCPISMLAASG